METKLENKKRTRMTIFSDREVVMSRTFDAPRALLFKIYTDPAVDSKKKVDDLSIQPLKPEVRNPMNRKIMDGCIPGVIRTLKSKIAFEMLEPA